MSNTLSEQLKKATKQNHQQLEKLMVARLRSISSRSEYVKLLQIFYSYFGGLEDKINEYIGEDQLPDFKERRKTESIGNDIKSMSGLIPKKAKEHDLPIIANHLHALGALYVIEGSTLGGKIISKMMTKQLGLEDKDGLSFFNSYGDDTEKMWSTFREILNRFQASSDTEPIIHSANDTFLKFSTWFEKMSLKN